MKFKKKKKKKSKKTKTVKKQVRALRTGNKEKR
jgi:hypothetical protein